MHSSSFFIDVLFKNKLMALCIIFSKTPTKSDNGAVHVAYLIEILQD